MLTPRPQRGLERGKRTSPPQEAISSLGHLTKLARGWD